jgi:hypothetical protein
MMVHDDARQALETLVEEYAAKLLPRRHRSFMLKPSAGGS